MLMNFHDSLQTHHFVETKLLQQPSWLHALRLKRVLQRAVLNELSKAILSGKIKKDSAVMMDLDGAGELIFENIATPELA